MRRDGDAGASAGDLATENVIVWANVHQTANRSRLLPPPPPPLSQLAVQLAPIKLSLQFRTPPTLST